MSDYEKFQIELEKRMAMQEDYEAILHNRMMTAPFGEEHDFHHPFKDDYEFIGPRKLMMLEHGPPEEDE